MSVATEQKKLVFQPRTKLLDTLFFISFIFLYIFRF